MVRGQCVRMVSTYQPGTRGRKRPRSVRAYSPTGDFLGEVAREGQGPGEIYGWPADLTFGPDGSLYIRDGSRVTVLAPSTPGEVADSLAGTWTVPGYGNLTSDRSRMARDGAYYYPDGSFRTGERPRFYHSLFRGGEITSDTLPVPDHDGMSARRPAFYRVGPGGGRLLDGLSRVPFAPVPTWDVTLEGALLSADGRQNRLVETDLAGDTLRVLPLGPDDGRPIPAGERADSLDALEERIDSLPVPLDEVVNLGEDVRPVDSPMSFPQVVGVHEIPLPGWNGSCRSPWSGSRPVSSRTRMPRSSPAAAPRGRPWCASSRSGTCHGRPPDRPRSRRPGRPPARA